MKIPGMRLADEKSAVRVEDVRSYEINNVYLGIPLLLLMENAGRAVADLIEYVLGYVKNRNIHVLAGKGGNGGDGFTAARHLAARGGRVTVHLANEPSLIAHPDARLNLDYLLRIDSVKVINPWARGWLDLSDADVVIDALLGIGVRGALRGNIRIMADAFNKSHGLRVAIDTPTGVDPDTGNVVEGAVRADYTITMGWPKRGLFLGDAPLYTGQVLVAEIGLSREASLYAGPGDLAARLPARPRDAHKGVGGRVLVVAGGEDYVGAALLASSAACISGIDLVFLASSHDTARLAATECSSVIPVPFQGPSLSRVDIERLLSLASKVHSVLIGPGLGAEESVVASAADLIKELLESGKTVVIDADGLKAVQKISGSLRGAILTPHRGEARMLAGLSGEPAKLARHIARKTGSVVLVKAPIDAVCDPGGKCRFNRSGVAAMSVGGTGDVLSGVLTGFLARRISKGLDPDPLNMAAAAAFAVGRAGELAYSELGEEITAREVLDKVRTVLAWSRQLATGG